MIPTHRQLHAIYKLWGWGLLSTEEATRAIQARLRVTDLGAKDMLKRRL